MSNFLKVMLAGLCWITVSIEVDAQRKSLTEEMYFKGNFGGVIQNLPYVQKWLDNSHFLLNRDGKTYVVDAGTGNEREQTDAERLPAKITDAAHAYLNQNDLYIKIADSTVRLTNDEAREVNPTMSPDGNYVAFTKKNDLYTVNIATKKLSRLTEDGNDSILNGYASWVYMEEILGRSSNYRAFWWSPDSKRIVFFRSDDSQVPLYTITDANGQHGYMERVRYPKVGDKNPQVRIGIATAEARSGDIKWAEFNPKDDQYFGKPYWKPDGNSVLVQWLNRAQNNLKIWEVNADNGSISAFYTENQKTWISLDDDDRITFLKNGKGFLLFSDSSGWRHLYNYDIKGKLRNKITTGNFTVTNIDYVDEVKSIVYFTARKENTARKDFYRVDMSGKNMQRLTFGDFNHTGINLSPDASYFVSTYSNISNPARLALVSGTGKVIKELASAKAAFFEEYEVAKTEVIRVKSDDGLFELPMKVTWPVNMDKSKKYPVIIYIYGGPDAGTVMDTYTLTGAQQWYAKEGLIQVAMDHRGSGHFGKAGQNYMHRNLGQWEIKDYSSLVKWLLANGNADPKKICITGFSYGGYLACYALTYGADIFTHGMAGGSVTDWSLYDTHYTERLMGLISDNADGYKNSSVLTHTDKYKGMLQIVHGVIDENVHLQNSMQLISKLQDEKKDFEFMMYSGGRHGWGGNKGAHFQNLKTKFIYKYLLEKEVPKQMLK